MSLYDYRESQEIEKQGYCFYALVMACMRQADTENSEQLQRIFPDIFKELEERYHTPGGLIESEKPKPITEEDK